MSPAAKTYLEKLIALFKGIVSKNEDDAEGRIRLVKGVVSTGTELLVELRAEQLKESVAR